MGHGLETAGFEPALGLLIYRVPGRQIVRHQAPESTAAHQPAQAIEDFAQVMVTLSGIQAQQGQDGGDEFPLFITDVAGVRLARIHAHQTSFPDLSS
jgi:hypothetical protein